MRMILVLIFIFIGVENVLRSKFKTCEQSGFCQRAFKENLLAGRFEFNDLNCAHGEISANIHDKTFDAKLVIRVYAAIDNRLRIYVNEKKSKFPRFDVFENGWKNSQSVPLFERNTTTERLNVSACRLIFNENVVTVDLANVRILVAKIDGSKIMMINAKDSLYIEPHLSDNNGEVPAETFDGHTDSQPHGYQAVSFDATFYDYSHIFGLPEHADTFKLNTNGYEPYRLFNLDVFEYELYNRMALYGSVPFLVAHNSKRTIGLHFINAAEMWVSILKEENNNIFFSRKTTSNIYTRWVAEAGVIDIVLMLGPTPSLVSQQNALTVGFANIPPIFAIAYHQCRWNYNDQQDIEELTYNLDKFRIPFDVVWLDIEHTPHRQYFQWDLSKFPEPQKMISRISELGRKIVTVVDPHVRKNEAYSVYEQVIERDYVTKTSRNETFVGWCWPGDSVYPDFIRPEVREWYSSLFSTNFYNGSTLDTYTWVDMNEPSVFNGPEVTVPKDLRHGDWENREVHNLYGSMVINAVYNGGLVRSSNSLRPFVLSRAFFSGSQKYGAVWTGDNLASWEHLAIVVPMLLSLSITGISFVGSDVSGFFKDPEPELFLRWYQAASMQPFFRAHSHIETKRREPYSFGKQITKQVREQILRRYRYLPYIYTLFYVSHTHGLPQMRPLWFEFPDDDKTFDIEDSYMFGKALLVKPIVKNGVTHVQMYFPGRNEKWFSLFNSNFYNSGQSLTIKMQSIIDLPLFQRSGTIVATWERQRRASSKMIDDPITLRLVLDSHNNAIGELYVDDMQTFDYKNGQFCFIQFKYSNNSFFSIVQGRFKSKIRLERIIIHGSIKNFISATIKIAGHNLRTLSVVNLSNSIVIRKPDVYLYQNFKIQLNL